MNNKNIFQLYSHQTIIQANLWEAFMTCLNLEEIEIPKNDELELVESMRKILNIYKKKHFCAFNCRIVEIEDIDNDKLFKKKLWQLYTEARELDILDENEEPYVFGDEDTLPIIIQLRIYLQGLLKRK